MTEQDAAPRQFDFACTKCGKPTLSITFIPENASHPLQEGKRQALLSGHSEVCYLGAESAGTVLRNLETADLAAISSVMDAARLACRGCNKLYCKDEWQNQRAVYDESGYDYTTAVCPEGHRGIIDHH